MKDIAMFIVALFAVAVLCLTLGFVVGKAAGRVESQRSAVESDGLYDEAMLQWRT